jgi:hypothetical protein
MLSTHSETECIHLLKVLPFVRSMIYFFEKYEWIILATFVFLLLVPSKPYVYFNLLKTGVNFVKTGLGFHNYTLSHISYFLLGSKIP